MFGRVSRLLAITGAAVLAVTTLVVLTPAQAAVDAETCAVKSKPAAKSCRATGRTGTALPTAYIRRSAGSRSPTLGSNPTDTT